jgi:hypothetical protein
LAVLSAIRADEVAEFAIDLCCLLDPAIEHGTPLAAILVQLEHTQEVACLENDFKRITEVVRETPYFLGVLKRDWRCAGRVSHTGAGSFAMWTNFDFDVMRKVGIVNAIVALSEDSRGWV